MIQKLTKNMTRRNKGFTLVELIIVIAIIAILVAVLLPRFAGFTDKAKQTQYLTDAKQIATAVDSYMAEGKALVKADILTLSGVTVAAGVTFNLSTTGADTGAFSLDVADTASPGPASGTTWYFGRTDDNTKVAKLAATVTDD